MKALTVRQPWADAIARGLKRIENRTWRTDYRGQLLIHAGLSEEDVPGRLRGRLALGSIIALVHLDDCLPLEETPDDEHAEGPWCWLLSDPIPLVEPVPCAGRLGLW